MEEGGGRLEMGWWVKELAGSEGGRAVREEFLAASFRASAVVVVMVVVVEGADIAAEEFVSSIRLNPSPGKEPVW